MPDAGLAGDAVALYYLVLTAIRSGLVRESRRALDAAEQWRPYVRCGWELLAVDLTLSGIVVLAVRGESFSYPGVSIFAMAAFAFYRVAMAVVRMGPGRQEKAPLVLAAGAVDASVAAVALFALQTAMLSAFAPGVDARVPNIALGTAVALVVAVLRDLGCEVRLASGGEPLDVVVIDGPLVWCGDTAPLAYPPGGTTVRCAW